MYIKREISERILDAASEFSVIAIVGPRQSGKTTLAQELFKNHRYVSLEDFDIRTRATTDPRGFLAEYPSASGIILDEIQHVPELLSYMQTIVDREKKKGFFIVTGSQNFLVDEAITQTLAGRMVVFTLLPLAIGELKQAGVLPERLETLVFTGGYPRAYAEKTTIERLYSSYIRLYVERDVRQVKNVADLSTFQKFMRLCAGRTGQILNLTSLGSDCGISQATAKAWISLLEASYIIFLLYPYYENFGKRLIKSPKLYFIDTGIACNLLKIRSAQELDDHYLKGGLVESAIIADFLKQQHNLEQTPSLYFWRDKVGHEVDCIIDTGKEPVPVEIKAGKTVVSDFFKEIAYWKDASGHPESAPSYLVYGGLEQQKWPLAQVMSWQTAGNIIKQAS